MRARTHTRTHTHRGVLWFPQEPDHSARTHQPDPPPGMCCRISKVSSQVRVRTSHIPSQVCRVELANSVYLILCIHNVYNVCIYMYVIMSMCTYLYLYLYLSMYANAHTQVPAQPWFSASGLTVLIGGVLPFGAVFVEVCLCIYIYRYICVCVCVFKYTLYLYLCMYI